MICNCVVTVDSWSGFISTHLDYIGALDSDIGSVGSLNRGGILQRCNRATMMRLTLREKILQGFGGCLLCSEPTDGLGISGCVVSESHFNSLAKSHLYNFDLKNIIRSYYLSRILS